MCYIQECLEDIDLAIKAGYPMELRHKLLLRRSDCYIELNQRAKAAEALTEAAQQAKSLKLTAVQTGEVTTELLINIYMHLLICQLISADCSIYLCESEISFVCQRRGNRRPSHTNPSCIFTD